MATDLTKRIERERPPYRAEVRLLIDTHGRNRWYVWVTNPITRRAIAVFAANDWDVLLHEMV